VPLDVVPRVRFSALLALIVWQDHVYHQLFARSSSMVALGQDVREHLLELVPPVEKEEIRYVFLIIFVDPGHNVFNHDIRRTVASFVLLCFGFSGKFCHFL